MKHRAIVILALASALSAGALAAQETEAAEEEKAWSLEVAADYTGKYVFRGVDLTGEPVLQPHVTFTYGDLSVYYWGYFGDTEFADTETGQGNYREADFGLDYTFNVTDTVFVTLGGVVYTYNDDPGFEDTTEIYGIASWDVLLAPTVSVYWDVDAIDGGYASIGVSHSVALGDKASLDLSGSFGLDFGYNIPESDPESGYEKSSADPNDILLGLDVPIQVTDSFSVHAGLWHSVALSVLDDIEQGDETWFAVGATYGF